MHFALLQEEIRREIVRLVRYGSAKRFDDSGLSVTSITPCKMAVIFVMRKIIEKVRTQHSAVEVAWEKMHQMFKQYMLAHVVTSVPCN